MTKARSCVCRLGLVFFLLQLTICQGAPRRAPTTYDQRQDGKFNFHANFDDTFVVFGIPSSLSSSSSSSSSSLADSDLASLFQSGFLSQALELKNTVTENTGNAASEGTASKNTESARSVLVDSPTLRSAIRGFVGRELTDQSDQRNDDKVKVFAIVRKNLPLDLETSEQLSDPSPEDDVVPKDTPAILQTQNTELNAPTLKITTRSVPENLDEKSQSENSTTVNSDDLNCIGREELRLLGDGIENCGPERYRDDKGVCQSCPTTGSSS